MAMKTKMNKKMRMFGKNARSMVKRNPVKALAFSAGAGTLVGGSLAAVVINNHNKKER